MFWRYIKMQRCAEISVVWRYCYQIAPEEYVGVRVCWN